jgi:hypothetical protein
MLIVGVILFLYGANYYDAFAGWTGVALFVSGFCVYAILKAYKFITKKRER